MEAGLKQVSLMIVGVAAGLCAVAALADNPGPKLDLAQASVIAARASAGTLEDHEYEQEDGGWRYSFDFRQSDGRIHEIGVDANSGKIVENDFEGANDKD